MTKAQVDLIMRCRIVVGGRPLRRNELSQRLSRLCGDVQGRWCRRNPCEPVVPMAPASSFAGHDTVN
jgi:hypothetical protein